MRRLQRRVRLVLRVAVTVVVQCGQLVETEGRRCRMTAVREAAVRVVLVDVVAEVEDDVEVLLGQPQYAGQYPFWKSWQLAMPSRRRDGSADGAGAVRVRPTGLRSPRARKR